MNSLYRGRLGAALLGSLVLGALLAACGSTAGASGGAATSPTPTCPPTRQFQIVTGHITALTGTSVTVTTSSGTATTFQLGSSTRITQFTLVTPAALTQGTPVQVITDRDATTAQRVSILPSGVGFGFGGGQGFGGARGTPPAGFNPACARRGSGAGQGFGQGNGFQGLRGTVDSATSTRLTFDDTQGQTYSVAITATTVIVRTASAQASDLRTGMTVNIIGSSASGQLTARTIVIQPPTAP
jgi:hypothetical protein